MAQPGTVNEFEMDLDWQDLEPILMTPGDQLQVIVGVNYHGASDAGQVRIHMGGDNPSSIEYTTQQFNEDPTVTTQPTETERFTGTLSGGNLFSCGNAEGVDLAIHEITVGSDAVYLRVDSRGSDLSGVGDLDISLYGGGTVIAGGHTAAADEGILLGLPAIEQYRGETLTLQVTVCLGANLSYVIDVEQA